MTFLNFISKTFLGLQLKEETKDGKISGEYRGMNTQNASGTVAHSSITDVLEGSTKLWIGKDYTNFIVKDFDKLDQPLKGLFIMKG